MAADSSPREHFILLSVTLAETIALESSVSEGEGRCNSDRKYQNMISSNFQSYSPAGVEDGGHGSPPGRAEAGDPGQGAGARHRPVQGVHTQVTSYI